MRAAPGDRMVVAPARVHGPVRDGEIVATGADGGPPYRIRWTDDGDVTLFFPGPDAHVHHVVHPDAATQQTTVRTKTWRIDVYLYEGEDSTSAQAVLHGDASTPVRSRGRARRRAGDPDVPEIGDEVAVSRALKRLSELLLRTASDDLAGITAPASQPAPRHDQPASPWLPEPGAG